MTQRPGSTSPTSTVLSTEGSMSNIPLVSTEQPFEEETLSSYNPQSFYPVYIGHVFKEQYEVMLKLGYGGGSTVWLVKNKRSEHIKDRYYALKVCVNASARVNRVSKEVAILRHIASARPNHPGYKFVRTMQDAFQIQGSYGTHWCMLFTPMTETVSAHQERWNGHIPGRYAGQIMKQCLKALQYLHDECHVIHTDIKLDNILIGVQDPSLLEQLIESESEYPSPRKIYPDRTIYITRLGTSFADETRHTKLSDFDGAVRVTQSNNFFDHTIQPVSYRAPEVIIEAPWTYSADIWNIGVLLWDMIEGHSLFSGEDPLLDHAYSYDMHYAEMIQLMGPPPKELLDRGKQTAKMFNADGSFKGPSARKRTWTDTLEQIEPPFRPGLIHFTSWMLQWLPETRKRAYELLEHPLMKNLPD